MSYDVDIKQLSLMALFDLKGTQSALAEWCGEVLPAFPEQAMRMTFKDQRELMFVGPEHYLLRAPLDQETTLLDKLQPEEAPVDISLVRVSDTLTFFSVSGPDAGEVMAIASPLDTHFDMFPAQSVTFSEAFTVKALILRTNDAFHLGVERSYGPMIADYLSRATAD